jgi:hypothetical protein
MTDGQFPLWFAIGLLGALSIVNAIVLVGVIRMVAGLYRAVLPNANPLDNRGRKQAPSFALETMRGREIDSDRYRGRLLSLLFVSPSCASCAASLEQLALVAVRAAGNIVLVCDGDRDECQALADRFASIDVIHDAQRRLRRLFEISKYPMSVLIGVDGRIISYGQGSGSDFRDIVESVEHLGHAPMMVDAETAVDSGG